MKTQRLTIKLGLVIAMGWMMGASSWGDEPHFSFTKKGPLIQRPEGMPSAGPYYPTLVKMDGVKDFPFEYALYFSTDHDNQAGGIWMYVCNGWPSEAANWKSYDEAVAEGAFDYLAEKPAANPIYRDAVQGHSSETPHAQVIDGKVYMTYHNIVAKKLQATMLATSPDGINFSRIHGDENSIVLEGSAHNGYFRWAPNPFSGMPYKYVGYSLYGGGDDYHSAMWVSNDAIQWECEQVFTPMEGLAVDEADKMLIWHEFDPGSVRQLENGEYIALCAGGNRASGSMKRTVEIYEIFLAEDGKTLTREALKVVPNGGEGSFDCEEAAEPTTIVIGDAWHLIYVGTTEKSKRNTIMSATGTLNRGAPESPKLSAENRQRHFTNK